MPDGHHTRWRHEKFRFSSHLGGCNSPHNISVIRETIYSEISSLRRKTTCWCFSKFKSVCEFRLINSVFSPHICLRVNLAVHLFQKPPKSHMLYISRRRGRGHSLIFALYSSEKRNDRNGYWAFLFLAVLWLYDLLGSQSKNKFLCLVIIILLD